MGRSLFGKLHRRFGTRLSGAERTRRAAEHHVRLRSAIPLDVLKASPSRGPSPGKVAIIGAGFAGCAAAQVAGLFGFDVTIYDPAGTPGGRVQSSTSVVPGRLLEIGAELIGLNHPAWIVYARLYGFALSVVTPDDDYSAALLNFPLILDGVSYNQAQQAQLYYEMKTIFDSWIKQSAVVTHPMAPWQTPNAAALDAKTLGAQIPLGTPTNVVRALETEFELNGTISIYQQSWLANLAQFQAGGGQGYFDDTEVFRCAAGNQQLAVRLLGDLPVNPQKVTRIDTAHGVRLTFDGGGKAGPFDYVIVATSGAIWPSIRVDGGPFPYASIRSGPAIKYLAPVATRFWIPEMLSPSGMSDTLGYTWEGTDNQTDTAAYDLTVFSGGSAAKHAIDHAPSIDAYFAPLIAELYPGFSTSGGTFENPCANPNIKTGYSCPGPGQVVGEQQSYAKPYNNCFFVAGEHTSPRWFGYMEGALESGLVAALRMAQSANVKLLPAWGGTRAL
jgi:monoamine oxidase